jgi:hypothetical protein
MDTLTEHLERIIFYVNQSNQGSGHCREADTGTATPKPGTSVKKRQRTIYGQASGFYVSASPKNKIGS